MKRYHNDLDEEIITCAECEENINEGLDDDRELFHSPVEVEAEFCDLCGRRG